MLVIIGEILKWCVDRVMVEMIIGVTTRIAVKEISGSRAGIGFKTMIEDLTIGDINLEIEKAKRRWNVLKVSDVKSEQTESINEVPVKLSAICMSPVELPYVPILLNETFMKALWDTGAEKSFISEETY
ncbi:uncharacterized protein TNCV_3538641 [Trichonephila clavipes]|nr:uncharacterized protein TNCV_3538641 [Trichonephila clavipes]